MSFDLLKELIIDKDLCEGCGLCAGFCKAIELVDSVPQLTGRCQLKRKAKECGLCYTLCPQAHPEQVIADSIVPLVTTSLRTTDEKLLDVVSNGGFVSTFLKYLLRRKKVDAAVCVTGEKREPVALTITKPGETSKIAGTRYGPSGVMNELAITARAVGRNLAVVGLPCELRGLHLLEERLGFNFLKIGLFCSNNNRLNEEGKVEKLGSCAHCTDFYAKHADISCGFAGSQKGFTSVIALTEKGKDLLETVSKSKMFEVGNVDFSKIQAAQTRKSKRELIEFEPSIRERIIAELEKNGPDEIIPLAKRLGLKPDDIFYHLLVLQTNGHIHVIENRKDPYTIVWSMN